jgi:hypothetical protein
VKPFVAATSDVVLGLLSDTDIAVPPRGLGRTKEHTQRWAIARFLATFAKAELIRFPLELRVGDRPDFVLVRAGESTGVEATEAIQEDHARVDALRNIRGYSEPRLSRRIRAGDAPKTLAEIEAIARGEIDDAGWVGNSVELDWAEAMHYVLRRKVERFEQPGYRKFQENWLLIYDNWELPFLDYDKAARRLAMGLHVSGKPLPFSRVFIETGNLFFEFQQATYSRWQLQDLWKVTSLG